MLQARKKYRRLLLGVAAMTVFVLAVLLIQKKNEEYVTPAKTVSVKVGEAMEVIPCGKPVGIYVETDGVLVVGIEELTDQNGTVCTAGSIVKAGDYITSVNGESIQKKAELLEAVAQSDGEALIVGIRRDGEEFSAKLQPVQTSEGDYKLGLWVRDNTQGIGMITYLTADGSFAALGHGISDADAESMMETARGLLYRTEILSVVKGVSGSPGELVGYIDYHKEYVIGSITDNTDTGIYGTVSEAFLEEMDAAPVAVGLKENIKKGTAVILAQIDDEVSEYEIEILSVSLDASDENKGIVFEVTDEALLEKTGGIVQGLSGSPILQDGKIIGAVTHVFVDDPTKGYGIFIENMLEAS